MHGSTEGDCNKDLCQMRLVDLYAPQGVDLGEGGSLVWHSTVFVRPYIKTLPFTVYTDLPVQI